MATVIPNALLGRFAGDTAQISTAINLATDSFKIMLLTSSHTPDIDADVFIDDVSANEVAASGDYSAGGFAVTITGSTDDTNDLGKTDGSDTTLTGATITARYGILYKDTGTPSTSPILVEYDFGSNKSSTAGDFVVTVNAAGLFTISQG